MAVKSRIGEYFQQLKETAALYHSSIFSSWDSNDDITRSNLPQPVAKLDEILLKEQLANF